MIYKVEIKAENAAFDDGNLYPELARLLRDAADHLDRGEPYHALFDINGNRVGQSAFYRKD